MFAGFVGIDRSSIDTVARTSGLIQDDIASERIAHIGRVAAIASELEAPFVIAHLGAISEDTGSDVFMQLMDRVRGAIQECRKHRVALLAETGQESADALSAFIEAIGDDCLGVNFDPGNIVLQDRGDPVRAVSTLATHIRQVHLKDAIPPAGSETGFGTEVPLGTGDANLPRVISKLRARGYEGPLLVERRLSDERQTIADDLEFVRSMLI